MHDPELDRRLAQIELKLDLILEALGVSGGTDTSDDLEREARALLGAGKKIHAIKLWRERTGSGLREAKDAIEALERR
ncbi:MAG TPA: hypothetical protein ENK18_20035 [Deltaproteobacteria bacterium]|nr:hypothetical protein [Deltaproteobacteria bacterium]